MTIATSNRLDGVLAAGATTGVSGLVPFSATYAPASTNIIGPWGPWKIGQLWVNTSANDTFVLTSYSSSNGVVSANWQASSGGSTILSSLTADSGIATPSGGTITISGASTGLTTLASGSTMTLTGTLVIANGGTGATSATAHGVVVANSTSAYTTLGVGSTGQVLIGATGANPAFGALGVNSGLTAHGVLLGENNSAIAATAAGSNGQVFLGSSGADPAFGTLTTSTGVTFTTGAHALAIDVKSGGFAVTPIAGTSSALAAQTSYVANNAGQTTFTLPATAAVGDQFIIAGGAANSAGWKIAQNALQTIHQNASASTTGATGTVTSAAHANETIALMCTTTNTDFVVLYASDTLSFA